MLELMKRLAQQLMRTCEHSCQLDYCSLIRKQMTNNIKIK